MIHSFKLAALPILAICAAAPSLAVGADSPAPAALAPTYADLADLADGTPLVVRAQVRKAVAVEPERARNVKPGYIRTFVEARTEALIGGNRALGEQLLYLVDVKADSKGKLPSLKKKSVILFARPVAGRPAELQLVSPDAQLAWDAATEARIKTILGEFYAAGAPPRITGVREALHVSGNLAGESESQIFLASASGEPAAITVARQAGRAPAMNASFSELVGAGQGLPARDTLAWYRLACFLPPALPAGANIAESADDRSAAARDYRAVIDALGSCPRTRR
ncbi:hypothetical protein B0I00_2841 [Novosphingobium kunmingense]|uniref:Uncharacterized protein n=1 Tax=Novosphingobium kunmingense TaxID=1211806 RepID=A0A2N0H5J9_9SPHN|nr:hypothetical protein [Novosphingobium kunmingense]PKB14209.1 hypothetical protein B0I00_2841 [Novosphingobium kunmingense]